MTHYSFSQIYRKMKYKVRQTQTIIQGIIAYHAQVGSSTPQEMIINLTYKCNSRCVMCNIWKMKPKNEMSFSEWKMIMKDKIFNQISSLTISGGEALLHPEIVNLTQLFIDSMPQLKSINIISNGFMPNVIEKKIDAMAKVCNQARVHLSVSISLDGINSRHESIRRIPNAFDKTADTINRMKKLCKKYDMSLGIGSLLMKQNLNNVDEVAKWAKENNVNLNFQLIGFHQTFVNNLETEQDLNYSKQQNKKLISVLKQFASPKNILDFRSYYWKDMINYYDKGYPRTTPCPFLKDQFVLDSLGDVYYCLSEPKIGNARHDKTISEIYYDKQNLLKRKQMKSGVCKKCNSGCNVNYAIAKDMSKYLWFRLTGQPYYGLRISIRKLFER